MAARHQFYGRMHVSLLATLRGFLCITVHAPVEAAKSFLALKQLLRGLPVKLVSWSTFTAD